MSVTNSVPRLLVVLFFSIVGLAGCSNYEHVLSSLDEQEANEIVALLRANNIHASKVAIGKQVFAVEVPSHSFVPAVQISYLWGYPKQPYTSLKSLFSSSGIVPTPMEERVRIITGITEELESTLDHIEGVTYVRVHLGLKKIVQRSALQALSDSEQNLPNQPVSKAAVYIKYDSSRVLLDTLLPRIRRLVSDSVPQLEPDNVTVLSQREEPFSTAPLTSKLEAHYFWRVKVRFEDMQILVVAFILLAGVGLILGVTLIFRLVKRNRK